MHALHGGSSSGMQEYLQMLQVSNGLMLNMTAHIALVLSVAKKHHVIDGWHGCHCYMCACWMIKVSNLETCCWRFIKVSDIKICIHMLSLADGTEQVFVKLLIEQKLGTGIAKKGNTSCMHSQEYKLCVDAKPGFKRGQNCAQHSGVTALMPGRHC